MALTEILVHLDPSPHCSARLELALELAMRHQARLTGCYAVPASLLSRLRSEEAMGEVRARFEDRIAPSAVHWRWLVPECADAGATVAEQLTEQALYADLVIVGQTDPRAEGHGGPGSLVERLLRASGRPVMVVPYVGSFPACGKRVLVAWKGGRESGRAVYDALPLLKAASQVSALSLIPAGAGEEASAASLARLKDYLAGHGVSVRGEQMVCSGISKADLLLNRVAEEGADLLVAGALAHGRAGTAARHLLEHLTVPVLMSH